MIGSDSTPVDWLSTLRTVTNINSFDRHSVSVWCQGIGALTDVKLHYGTESVDGGLIRHTGTQSRWKCSWRFRRLKSRKKKSQICLKSLVHHWFNPEQHLFTGSIQHGWKQRNARWSTVGGAKGLSSRRRECMGVVVVKQSRRPHPIPQAGLKCCEASVTRGAHLTGWESVCVVLLGVITTTTHFQVFNRSVFQQETKTVQLPSL